VQDRAMMRKTRRRYSLYSIQREQEGIERRMNKRRKNEVEKEEGKRRREQASF
jgi:hypothetical protein